MKYYVYHGTFCSSFVVEFACVPKRTKFQSTDEVNALLSAALFTFKQPSLADAHVAEDRGKIVGYVLAKLDEESPKVAKGHITSLSVLRTHRKLGIAAKLMIAANDALMTTYKTESCSLHVRVSNKAALHLYVDTLGYENTGTEKANADGEDAHNMRLTFKYGLKDQGLTDDELKVLERLGLLDVK